MRFGKHLGKGLWAFADKSLPAVYGVGFIFLVVRVLPEKEYGAFAVLQSVFTIVTALAFSLAQQPLTKFAAETRENGAYIVAGFILNVLFFGLVSLAAVMFSGEFAALLDPANSRIIEGMLSFLPVLLAAALIRGLTVSLLQADYQIQKIFWIDAAYFLGTMIMVYGASKMGRFNTATDLVHLNTIGLALSSAVGLVLTLGHLRVKLPFRRDAFIRMWDFGKYNVGTSANYLVFSQMDVFIVSRYVGLYSLAGYSAAKILTRIYDMLAQVLQMLLIPASSRLYSTGDRENLRVVTEKSIFFSAVLFLPVFLFIIFFPNFFLHLLYKGKYDSAAGILQVFGVLALIVPWNSVFSSIFVGIGQVKFGFYLGPVISVIFIGLSWLLAGSNGALGVAAALVLSNLVTVLCSAYYMKRFVAYTFRGILSRYKDALSFALSKLPG